MREGFELLSYISKNQLIKISKRIRYTIRSKFICNTQRTLKLGKGRITADLFNTVYTESEIRACNICLSIHRFTSLAYHENIKHEMKANCIMSKRCYLRQCLKVVAFLRCKRNLTTSVLKNNFIKHL